MFLTAHDCNGERAVAAYQLGAIDYICKPFNAAILCSKVAFFVELFRKTVALELRTAGLTVITVDLVRREQQIAALNTELGERVVERTAELGSAITQMKVEAGERLRAEQ